MYFTDLNYDNYDDYLSGEEWAEIHEYIYQSKVIPYRCRVCHIRKDLLLHKRSYIFLHPKKIKLLHRRYLKKIFVWLCREHNQSIHFYNKTDKVPLDYIFLWEREQKVFWYPHCFLQRVFRTIKRFFVWGYWSYRLGKRRPSY